MGTGAIVGLSIGLTIVGLIIGALLGFFLSQKYFKRQMDENPPITREQIKMLFKQTGRTPSEAQLNSTMENFKRQSKKK